MRDAFSGMKEHDACHKMEEYLPSSGHPTPRSPTSEFVQTWIASLPDQNPGSTGMGTPESENG